MAGGAAVSGFVDGLFKGIGARHSWEDRKRNQKREDRADAIRDNIEKRAAEEHARRMGVYDREASDWNRSRADDDYYRSVIADAAAATDESFGAMPQGEATAGKPNEAPKQPDLSPAQEVAANLGIDPRVVRPDMRAGAAMMERLSPAEKLAAEAETKAVVAKRAGDEKAVLDRRAQFEPGPEMARGYGVRPETAKPYTAGVTFLPDGTAVLPAPRGAIADEVAAARGGPVGPSFVPTERLYTAPPPPEAARSRPRPGMSADELMAAVEAAQGPSAASKRALEARPDRTRAIEKSAAAFTPPPPPDTRTRGQRISDAMGPVRRIAVESADKTLGAFTGMGAEAYGTLQQGAGYVAGAVGAPETADMLFNAGGENRRLARKSALEGWSKAYLPGDTGAGPEPAQAKETAIQGEASDGAAPGAVPPPNIPMKAAATPQEKKDAAAAVEVLDKTATPAAKDATVAATQAMGVRPQQKTITDAQYKRGGEAWMRRYNEILAPRLMEAYVTRGDFEKAMKFQEFMQSSSTKTAMKDLGIASTAFILGDADKGASHMMKVFNNLGYFPDGTQVVEDETDFTRDKDGNINGLKMTFRDVDSGNTWEMVETGDVTSLMTKMIPLVMPENAFESYWKQQSEAAASAMGAASEFQARIDKLAIEIFKQSADSLNPRKDNDGNPLPPVTMGEARAEALRAILGAQEGDGTAPQVPPVVYRPN